MFRSCHTSVQGKAHCFEKVNGKLVDRFVIEPVASAALEALSIGTSFLSDSYRHNL